MGIASMFGALKSKSDAHKASPLGQNIAKGLSSIYPVTQSSATPSTNILNRGPRFGLGRKKKSSSDKNYLEG